MEYSLLTTLYSGGDKKGGRFSQGWVPVEFALQTPLDRPLAGRTTSTINPGVISVARYLQFAVEAIAPAPANERGGAPDLHWREAGRQDQHSPGWGGELNFFGAETPVA